MSESYPLDNLLSVRLFREETAKRGVSVAQASLREARENLESRKAELEAWRKWRDEEVERRYDALIGTKLPIGKLIAFNQGIARLADDELARAAAVDKSAETVRTCEKKVEDAKALVHTARQNTAKIEAHKALWSEDLKKEEERAEEREFEDFKPVSRLGAEGEDS